jgi:hypothetical protein
VKQKKSLKEEEKTLVGISVVVEATHKTICYKLVAY